MLIVDVDRKMLRYEVELWICGRKDKPKEHWISRQIYKFGKTEIKIKIRIDEQNVFFFFTHTRTINQSLE